MSHRNKRFWTDVDVVPEAAGFVVRLDGKPVLVPDHGPLLLPRLELAEAVATEWREAGGGTPGGVYGPEALGLTRLCGSMLVRVAPRRDAVIDDLLDHLDGDALCYRATHPAALVARQQRDWQPWLDWCGSTVGAALQFTAGIMPIRQTDPVRSSIRIVLHRQDDAGLCALGVLAPLLGSLVLALACVSGALPAAEAFALSILDDRFQEEQWGHDGEAAERQARLLSDCMEAERFLGLATAQAEAARSHRVTHLLVQGRVQGVGYRAWLHREALRLGLQGWVRNLGDGRVEALLHGSEPARAELLRAAGTGPRMADVRSVRAVAGTTAPGAAANGEFQIRPTANEPDADFVAETQ